MKTKHNCSNALFGTALISCLFSMPALAADETGGTSGAPGPSPSISSPAPAMDAATICKDMSGEARLECLRDHRAMMERQDPGSSAMPAPPAMNVNCMQTSASEREACEKASRDNAG